MVSLIDNRDWGVTGCCSASLRARVSHSEAEVGFGAVRLKAVG
jgi:hypothetical protein